MVDAAYQHIAEEITGNVYLGVQILNRKGGERVRLQIRVDEKYGSSFTSSYCSETARRRIDLNNGCDVLRKPQRERAKALLLLCASSTTGKTVRIIAV